MRGGGGGGGLNFSNPAPESFSIGAKFPLLSAGCPLSSPGFCPVAEPGTFTAMDPRYASLFLCVFIPLCASHSGSTSHLVLEPYDFLFDTAVDAYNKGDWLTVILNMEKALRNKATLRSVKAQCRINCANQTVFGDSLSGSGGTIPGAGSVDDLGFFQKILKRADCVYSCESEKLGSRTMHLVTADVELEFTKRTPYNYLQVAYFKVRI